MASHASPARLLTLETISRLSLTARRQDDAEVEMASWSGDGVAEEDGQR